MSPSQSFLLRDLTSAAPGVSSTDVLAVVLASLSCLFQSKLKFVKQVAS